MNDSFYDFPAIPPLPHHLRSLLVFGGSFDPPHRAHLALAKSVADTLGSERILLIPTNRSPHKMAPRRRVSGADRLEMVKLAIADDAMISVSCFELERPPPSYTVETLQALRTSLGLKVGLRWLLGSDQALSFECWHEWERILQLAKPALVLRPPQTSWQDLVTAGLNPRIFNESMLVTTPLDGVSSTTVRQLIAKGEAADEFLAPRVSKFITQHGLYIPDE